MGTGDARAAGGGATSVHELPVDPEIDASPPPRRRLDQAQLRRQAGHVLRGHADILAVIALGGALGSLARWGMSQALPSASGRFAWATVVDNLTGSLLLGILMVFVIEVGPPSRYVRPFLGVGVLGGFTTFSTAMLDVRELIMARRPVVAGGYLAVTVVGGLLAVWLGITLARGALALARARRRRSRDGRRP